MFGGKIGVPELFILLCFFFLVPLMIAAWWRIFARTGYPGVLGLSMFVPGINVVVFLWFAFMEWPIEREKRERTMKASG